MSDEIKDKNGLEEEKSPNLENSSTESEHAEKCIFRHPAKWHLYTCPFCRTEKLYYLLIPHHSTAYLTHSFRPALFDNIGDIVLRFQSGKILRRKLQKAFYGHFPKHFAYSFYALKTKCIRHLHRVKEYTARSVRHCALAVCKRREL